MTSTGYYKRLALELFHARRTGDLATLDRLLTPDFVDTAGAGVDDLLTTPEATVLGLVGEGTTVVLRLRDAGVEWIEFFEGRDSRLATRHCVTGRSERPMPDRWRHHAAVPVMARAARPKYTVAAE